MNLIITISFAFMLFLLSNCTKAEMTVVMPVVYPPDTTDALRYLALGDSYTIGEGVAETQRYPFQLAERFKQNGIEVDFHKIIARTGWTTADLQNAINYEKPDSNWHLVSLLIGVNNQYRGQAISRFQTEYRELLENAIALAGGKAENVFVLSIPDYGVTPFGINSGKSEQISEEIDTFNSLKEEISKEYKVSFYYITDISRMAKDNPALLAPDKLHPSGQMYKMWIDRIYDGVKSGLD